MSSGEGIRFPVFCSPGFRFSLFSYWPFRFLNFLPISRRFASVVIRVSRRRNPRFVPPFSAVVILLSPPSFPFSRRVFAHLLVAPGNPRFVPPWSSCSSLRRCFPLGGVSSRCCWWRSCWWRVFGSPSNSLVSLTLSPSGFQISNLISGIWRFME